MKQMNNIEINNSNVNEIIADKAIGYDKLSIDVLLSGQTIKSKNYVADTTGWIINGNGEVNFIDLGCSSIKLIPQASAPTSETGRMYVTTSGVLKIYNGSAWVSVGAQT